MLLYKTELQNKIFKHSLIDGPSVKHYEFTLKRIDASK